MKNSVLPLNRACILCIMNNALLPLNRAWRPAGRRAPQKDPNFGWSHGNYGPETEPGGI